MPFVNLTFKGQNTQIGSANWFTFGFYTSDGVVTECQTLAEAMRDRFNGNMRDRLSQYYLMNRIDSQWYPSLNSEPFPTQVHTVDDVAGIQVGHQLAPRTTLLIEFKAFSTKPNRKRCYVGLYTEDVNDPDGTPGSVLISSLQAFGDDMVSPHNLSGHTYSPAVLRISSENRVTAYNILTSHLVSNKWAFLRSRDAGRGL